MCHGHDPLWPARQSCFILTRWIACVHIPTVPWPLVKFPGNPSGQECRSRSLTGSWVPGRPTPTGTPTRCATTAPGGSGAAAKGQPAARPCLGSKGLTGAPGRSVAPRLIWPRRRVVTRGPACHEPRCPTGSCSPPRGMRPSKRSSGSSAAAATKRARRYSSPVSSWARSTWAKLPR